MQSKNSKQRIKFSSPTAAPAGYKAPWLGANIFIVLLVAMMLTIAVTIAVGFNGGFH
ncbi:hypothetical protein LMC05_10520 [Limosilactobacillus reuteri]|uniref:hypothetical protein n=1 Tax=Limosilactobacillus reuteri TaxID=1598 RepID=UPI001E5BBED1|nr:hypothetical protein [Limosilactobacillus reuteri]MCC4509425.1 hypothetical protein [Limosilactobacillus reuteri]